MAKTYAGPAAPAAPSSKPGTKAPEAAKPEKAKKAPRQYYPGLEAKPVIDPDTNKPRLSKQGKQIVRPTKKLAAVPADFDIKAHKPLGRNDFEDESLWYELRAQDYERKAKEMREQGAEIKALGGIEDRKEAKKLLELQKKMAELTAKLKGKNVDVDGITKRIEAQLAEKKAKKEATEAAKS